MCIRDSYNVEAVFEAPSIKSASAYVGNIKPGETGNVDVMLSGVAATEDDGTIPVKINYENVNGEKFSEDAKITLTVVEKLETDMICRRARRRTKGEEVLPSARSMASSERPLFFRWPLPSSAS